jgi:catechol 2,3-dioxygenase-like lactoylglutathione lyase family enzyme
MRHGGSGALLPALRLRDAVWRRERELNLIAEPAEVKWWGRAIFYDDDVDGLYARLVAAGVTPQAPPRDAPWGERFFHVTDPDGHEISFAWPLKR